MKHTECKTCLFDSSMAIIHDDGECEYCKLQAQLRSQAREPWENVLKRIKGSGKKYDCLIGISGGEDSSVLLWLAVKKWGLNPLVIHFDNRSNRQEADHNIELLTNMLGVNFIRYYPDQQEYDRLTDAFLMAGVPDADIPNDIAMAKLMYNAAVQYGIKYILNGHDYRREGSSPSAWSYMDAKYLQSVYNKNTGLKLKNYPLYTFWDQIKQAFFGIKQVRPYHYSDHDRFVVLDKLKQLGWKDYGGKHNENIYTAYVGNYLLPKKFGIDKRKTYLSAKIREGMISKAIAKNVLEQPVNFNLDDLGDRKDRILMLSESGISDRSVYDKYNFKKYKLVIWILAKMKIVPWTMYVKYCR